MKRKYWCRGMESYKRKYNECDVVTMEELKQITEETVVAVEGKNQPWQINRLSGLVGYDAAKQRGECIWQNEKGYWSGTPFGKFLD